MRSRLTAVLASSLLFVLVLVAPAEAAFPGKNGKIAYSCRVPDPVFSEEHICVANPDGSGMATLAEGWGPVWSPDGTQIAFEAPTGSPGSPQSKIYLMNADGTAVTDVDASPPSWAANYIFGRAAPPLGCRVTALPPSFRFVSPDGRLATSWGEPVIEISPSGLRKECSWPLYVENADGTHQQQIGTRLNVAARYGNDWHGPIVADWSPESNRVLLRIQDGICGDGCHNDESLQIVTLGPTPVATDPFAPLRETHPTRGVAWSPDGTKLINAYTRTALCEILPPFLPPYPCPKAVITVIDLDDMSETDLPLSGSYPNWQPIPGPKRSDYKNAAKFCKAEQDFWGDQFASRYGGGKNAFGKCVSGK